MNSHNQPAGGVLPTDEEIRTAFRLADSVNPMRHKTPWQIWREAFTWATGTLPTSAIVTPPAPVPADPVAVPDGWRLVPIEPTREMVSAMASSKARDDEGEFPAMLDLIDYSGENKTHAVLKAAYADMLAAAPLHAEGGSEA